MSTVRTEHVQYLLPDFVAGSLDPEQHVLVKSHLHECGDCAAALAEIESVFNQVKAAPLPQLPQAYFSNLIPRIRQRLEGQSRYSWISSPIFAKLVLPLFVTVLAVSLLVNLPPVDEQTDSPLKNAVAGVNPEDVVAVVLEKTHTLPWTTGQVQEAAERLVAEHLTDGHFLEEALMSVTNEQFEQTVNQQLLELDETQVERLLQKLGERTLL